MESQKITITIDTDAGLLMETRNDNDACPKQKLVTNSHAIDVIRAALLQASLNTKSMEVTVEKKASKQKKLSKHSYAISFTSPTRSPMPTLPYPPKHMTNNAWKKTPPIPKLTLFTEPAKIKLTWDDGISMGSCYRYATIAGYELFACVIEGCADDAKWEHLTFIPSLPPSQDKRRSNICEMADLVTGIEYYFAVRSVDVHDRRGPCAVVYTRL